MAAILPARKSCSKSRRKANNRFKKGQKEARSQPFRPFPSPQTHSPQQKRKRKGSRFRTGPRTQGGARVIRAARTIRRHRPWPPLRPRPTGSGFAFFFALGVRFFFGSCGDPGQSSDWPFFLPGRACSFPTWPTLRACGSAGRLRCGALRCGPRTSSAPQRAGDGQSAIPHRDCFAKKLGGGSVFSSGAGGAGRRRGGRA